MHFSGQRHNGKVLLFLPLLLTRNCAQVSLLKEASCTQPGQKFWEEQSWRSGQREQQVQHIHSIGIFQYNSAYCPPDMVLFHESELPMHISELGNPLKSVKKIFWLFTLCPLLAEKRLQKIRSLGPECIAGVELPLAQGTNWLWLFRCGCLTSRISFFICRTEIILVFPTLKGQCLITDSF